MGDFFALPAEGVVLRNVHAADQCAGEHCPIHNPSEHPLKNAHLHWRGDMSMFERICKHGIGHYDPDSVAYMTRVTGMDGWGVHGCDGCCFSREEIGGDSAHG